MEFLRVIKPGFLTSVQDLGRQGFASTGVSEAGAADAYSLRIGNMLVGNPEGAAGLEMTLVGGTFEVLSDAVIAVTGSDFAPALDGRAMPSWESLLVEAGHVLSFGATRFGARCYLCVSGGIDVPEIMKSRSTHLLTKIGGLDGRALRENDFLHTFQRNHKDRELVGRKTPGEAIPLYSSSCILRVILGPDDDYFKKESIETFLSSYYVITESSDRVGLRLDGALLEHSRGADIPSEGVTTGAIQVPANGLPIILFVERPTTGGYPTIASVISADLHRVGQARPRDTIRFQSVSVEEAVELLKAQEGLIKAQKPS